MPPRVSAAISPTTRPVVQPHENDAALGDPPRAAATKTCRVCVIGAIGIHKGYQVVLDCARDAAERRLPLEFVVVGHTIDDRRLLATRRVFVTGSYAADEVVTLIKAQNATHRDAAVDLSGDLVPQPR